MPQRKRPKSDPDRTVEAIFARRLREARKARGWTQQDLVDRLDELGVEWDRTTLARIEKRQRKVGLEEFVAIAAALDVAPIYLFLPIEGDVMSIYFDLEGNAVKGSGKRGRPHGVPGLPPGVPPVQLTPNLPVDQVKARRWAAGELPLAPENFAFYLQQNGGDRMVSAEELTPAQQEAVAEERRRQLVKLGVQIVEEKPPTKQPKKRGRGASARKGD